jgi:hypothetical protein
MSETFPTTPWWERLPKPPVIVTRAQAHTVGCPTCAAHPNKPCTQPTDTGRTAVPWVHLSREAEYLRVQEEARLLAEGEA